MNCNTPKAALVTTILTSVLLFLAVPALADVHTVTWVATDDACVDSAFPNANYGSSINLYVGDRTPAAGGTCLTFLQFDISDLTPANEVLNAELLLRKHEKYGAPDTQMPVSVHHITMPGWSENAITWNAPPGYTTAATATVTATFNPPGWAAWDVTADVIADHAQNRSQTGWCVKFAQPLSWLWLNFYSREQVPMPDYRPQLVITYSGPVGAESSSWSEVKSLYR